MSQWERFVDTFLNRAVLAQYAPDILKGVWVTIELSLMIVVIGTFLGTVLALIRAYEIRILTGFIVVFADVFRALPPLVLILIIFFGLPNAGIFLSSFLVLFLVLMLILAAFSEEIIWAGITSVDRGQWEASRSTGLGFSQSLIWVVLPQAMRLAIPPLTNRAIAITKMTALGTVMVCLIFLTKPRQLNRFLGMHPR